MKQNQYKIKPNATIKNRLNNDLVRGDLINEKDIDGKQYWVMVVPERHNAQLSYSKDSWVLVKGK